MAKKKAMSKNYKYLCAAIFWSSLIAPPIIWGLVALKWQAIICYLVAWRYVPFDEKIDVVVFAFAPILYPVVFGFCFWFGIEWRWS